MSKPYTVERYDNREDWLRARRKSIGSSDAGVIVGASKWSSPFSIWKDKTGRGYDDRETPEQRFGKMHEPTISRWFGEETGFQVKDPGEFTIYRSANDPWWTVTIDRWAHPGLAGIEILDEVHMGWGVVELKCCHPMMAKEWRKSIPGAYWLQMQSQFGVTGARWGCICVMLGIYEFKWFPVVRNDRAIVKLRNKLKDWWQYVETDTPPPVDGHDATTQALQRFWEPDPDRRVDLYQAEWMELAAEYDDAVNQIANFTNRKAEIANQFKFEMAEAETAVLSDDSGFTWKANKNGVRTFKRKDKIPQEVDCV